MATSTFGSEIPKRPMNTIIDVEIIKKIALKDIITLIKKCSGDKVVIWDRALANPINLVADHSDFKTYGVTMMFPLDDRPLPQNIPENIIFICRPISSLMPSIVSCIKNEERQSRKRKYHILFIPKVSYLCKAFLEEENVLRCITSIEDVPILLFPLDNDVLTMEIEHCFKEFYVDKDYSSLHQVARALVFLEKKYGTPNFVFGKGDAAAHVYEIMQCIKKENGVSSQEKGKINGTKIDNMILIDRKVDLLSPMVTQLTYEGLIDEFYGIQNNNVKFPEEKFGKTKTMLLNSKEDLYFELRDKNFSAVGGILREKTKEIQEILKQKDRDLREMKRLVQQLPAVNTLKDSLSNHTSVAELIKAQTENDDFLSSLECEQELLNGMDTDKINTHIENLCNKQAPLNKLLRLIIIQNITSGGLKAKILQHYERLIIQNYGFEHILTLNRLHDVGLLRPQLGSRSYSVLRRMLNLTVCDGSETKPEDFSYVHSIYAPLSIRLIQYRLKPNLWNTIKDSLYSIIPGPVIDKESYIPSYANVNTGVVRKSRKTSLIVFIGGCTFAEIAALRFLAQQEDDWEFLVVTTKIINGNSFLNCLYETLEKPN